MIAIGSNFFAARGDAGRRQQRAQDALLTLRNATPIALQFADDDYAPGGLPARRVLERDSRTVTGAGGARKPIVSEMLDALAADAAGHGCRYIAYVNADVEVTQAAIDRIVSRGLDAYAFCRVDVDAGTRANPVVQLLGIDLFAADLSWWRRHRRRFRPYIAGEACWDNVYAAIACSHGRAEIVHDVAAIVHERHEATWAGGPFADYNGYLAVLDAPYFTRWATYVARLESRTASGRSVDPAELVADVFSGPLLTTPGRIVHAARTLRARARRALRRGRQ